MFPFDLQARFAKAWLDATAAGLATAGCMGTAAVQAMETWSGGAHARNGAAGLFGSGRWPMPPTLMWPWGNFTGVPGAGYATWPMSMTFSGADWMRAMSLGSAFASWSLPSAPHITAFPSWDLVAALAAPPQHYATLFWSWPLRQMETGWPVISSYRTSSGHATSMLLRGFDFMPSRPFYAWPDLSRTFFTR